MQWRCSLCCLTVPETDVYVAAGKGGFLGLEDGGGVLLEEGHLVDGLGAPVPLPSPSRSSPRSQGSENGERFSRKVFVGGLPPDIDEGVCIVCLCVCIFM